MNTNLLRLNKRVCIIFLTILFSSNLFSQIWEKKEWFDEFLDPTGKFFISTTCDGVMSNSATTKAKLQSLFQVDNDQILIGLLEYNDSPSSSLGNYFIKVKDEKGKVYEFEPIKSKGWKIQFTKNGFNQDYYKLRKLFETNSFLKFSIKDEYSSLYVFRLDLTNYLTSINNIDIHSIPLEYKMGANLEKEPFARIDKNTYAVKLNYDGITYQVRLCLKDINRHTKKDTCYFLAQKNTKAIYQELKTIELFMRNADYEDAMETSCGKAIKFNNHFLYLHKGESSAKLSKDMLYELISQFAHIQ